MTAVLYQQETGQGETKVSLSLLEDGVIQIRYEDRSERARNLYGDSSYESWAAVSPDQFQKLVFALLFEKFTGRADALSAFRDFCVAHGVTSRNGGWS